MKGLIIVLSIISLLSAGIVNDLKEFEVRVFNESNFKIENYEIDINGVTTKFSNIKPHNYSQRKMIEHFDKFTFFNITVSKKIFLGKDFRTNKVIFPIGITCYFNGDSDNFSSGKYLIKLKIENAKNDFVKVSTEYIKA